MNYTDVGLFILGTGLSGISWFAKTIYSDLKEAKKDITILQVKLGSEYISYERLKDIMEPVMTALNDIKETLKTKADK